MKTIIVENIVYKVTEKEYKQLQYMENKINSAQYPESFHLEVALSDYFTDNVERYVKVGSVDFHFQL
jgi:hypothetical protein